VEIISWLDVCPRYALHVSVHPRVTGSIVRASFRTTLAQHGIPASTLTLPGPTRDPTTHDRLRHDRIDKAGSVTLRSGGRLHHIGVGRTHAGTCVS
jgi:hypothetical protein